MPEPQEKSFEDFVKECAANEMDLPIANSTMDHAFIGSKYLILKAQNKIRIVTDCFLKIFWENLFTELKGFLQNKQDGIIEIVIVNWGAFHKEGAFDKLKSLTVDFADRVKVYDFQKKALIHKSPNFLSIDDKGYRLELSDERRKERLVEGVINFGDQATSTSLNTLFEQVKTISSPATF